MTLHWLLDRFCLKFWPESLKSTNEHSWCVAACCFSSDQRGGREPPAILSLLWPWREVVLVSDFEMRDGVSQYIHGTFPERNLLVQLNEKKMENTFGWSMANKNREMGLSSQFCCVKIGTFQNIPEPASVLTVTWHSYFLHLTTISPLRPVISMGIMTR